MIPRDVFAFVQIGIDIQSFYGNFLSQVFPQSEMGRDRRQAFVNKLAEIGTQAQAMGLDKTVVTIDCLIHEYRTEHTEEQLKLSLESLSGRFQQELQEHRFVQFDPARIEFLVTTEEFALKCPWGNEVVTAFRSASRDMFDAGLCHASYRATACVFHCMRVLERGLRALATELSVPFSIPFEYQEWSNIIDGIHSAVKQLEQALPRGQEKSQKLKMYGDAALHCFHFKNAWRNHISHARDICTNEEAEMVFRHTREFIACLVKNGLKE